MSSTSAMRNAWSPPCKGPWTTIALYGEGKITVKSAAAPAFHALNGILRKWNYRTRRADTGAYNCRKITGGSGYSLHAYGIAADINWQSNPYGPRLITDMPMGMIREIESLRTRSGQAVFRWGGRYAGNKDAMHFEVFVTPAQLATGIVGGSSPVAPERPETPQTPVLPNKDGVDMYIAVTGVGFFAQIGNVTVPLPGLTLAGLADLTKGDKSAPIMVIPEAAAHDFVAKTAQQTQAATGAV